MAFIVDTGSPLTFIDEFDSNKARVFTKDLMFDHSALMGGTKVAMYKGGKTRISFRDENGGLVAMGMDDIKVAKTEWTRKGAVYSSSSILGLDFFLENKASLFVDPDRRLAYIEK